LSESNNNSLAYLDELIIVFPQEKFNFRNNMNTLLLLKKRFHTEKFHTDMIMLHNKCYVTFIMLHFFLISRCYAKN